MAKPTDDAQYRDLRARALAFCERHPELRGIEDSLHTYSDDLRGIRAAVLEVIDCWSNTDETEALTLEWNREERAVLKG